MAYLKDFLERIQNNDYPGFLKIWEEYCYGDQPDGEEMVAILEHVRQSDIAKPFGLQVERLIPLWRQIIDPLMSLQVLRLIVDIQTTNSEELADLSTEFLKNHYANDPLFSEKMRLIGLRNRDQFQGAIRNFELLTHLEPGNFIFHTAGWGTGEIMTVSLIREEISAEFEYVVGTQHLSFEKAFKTLKPLSKDHFYARRFGNPDLLEEEAKKNPLEIIYLILHDLGPKTASDLKEELCDLVIPQADWNRWWQNARAKLKKHTKIESPKELKDPFRLRDADVPHEVLFYQALEENPAVSTSIQMIYTFLRDFPETLKNSEFKTSLQGKIQDLFDKEISESQRIQLLFFQEDLGMVAQENLDLLFSSLSQCVETVSHIQILSFQKRALQKIKMLRKDWNSIFLDLLFSVEQNLLRDFLLSELHTEETKEALKQKLSSLLIYPLSYPEVFFWYFSKIVDEGSNLPFADAAGKNRFFEGLLILFDHLSEKVQYRDLAKKILNLITAERYKLVREIMQNSSLEEVKEYILLSTKCSLFSDHDIKILYSLAEVAHPSIGHAKKNKDQTADDSQLIWTTQEGYQATQQRVQKIATVETVHNAKEIETARAHGDLRENAEFKAALERRSRLQSELKLLSDQLSNARILTPEDVSVDEVGVGTIVHCKDSKGASVRFTLLGPWDADPEKRILSFQSKLAQAMKGKTVGQTFEFQGEKFSITAIDNYFDQERSF
jgi:transcription elongation factor GreA-like protein/transcription elongation GreA/GreB family factor